MSLYNAFGSTDVVADVTGWFSDGTTAAGSTFVGVAPTRLLDTRDGTGGPVRRTVGAPGDGRCWRIAGAPGSPVPAGATAAVVNLTAVAPTAPTFLQTYLGPTAPGTATLNAEAGQTVANLAVVPLDAAGEVTIRNAFGLGPRGGRRRRVLHRRPGRAVPSDEPPPGRRHPRRDGRRGPARRGRRRSRSPSGVRTACPRRPRSVVLNVTATGPSASGFLTVFPGDSPRPLASTLNFEPGATVANLVTVPLSPTGQFTIFNSAGRTDVVVDVAGWFE